MLSFAWTVIVVILLHVRDWFPFKIKVYTCTHTYSRSYRFYSIVGVNTVSILLELNILLF